MKVCQAKKLIRTCVAFIVLILRSRHGADTDTLIITEIILFIVIADVLFLLIVFITRLFLLFFLLFFCMNQASFGGQLSELSDTRDNLCALYAWFSRMRYGARSIPNALHVLLLLSLLPGLLPSLQLLWQTRSSRVLLIITWFPCEHFGEEGALVFLSEVGVWLRVFQLQSLLMRFVHLFIILSCLK